MVRRANSRRGRKTLRKERSIILIAAEGSNKTERAYFLEFNRLQKKYKIIMAGGNNTDPVKIVQDAADSAKKKDLDLKSGDLVYAVFDTDVGKEKQIEKTRKIAKNEKVGLILSNPCFELWLLMHFTFSTKSYSNNKAVCDELMRKWPKYKKNINSFEEIRGKQECAIKNAKKLKTFHIKMSEKTEIENCNPSTDVYQLVEMLTV